MYQSSHHAATFTVPFHLSSGVEVVLGSWRQPSSSREPVSVTCTTATCNCLLAVCISLSSHCAVSFTVLSAKVGLCPVPQLTSSRESVSVLPCLPYWLYTIISILYLLLVVIREKISAYSCYSDVDNITLPTAYAAL